MIERRQLQTITIIYPPAGFGLLKDAKILEASLSSMGYQVELCEFSTTQYVTSSRAHSFVLSLVRKFNLIFLWRFIQRKLWGRPKNVYVYLENIAFQKLFHNVLHVLIPNQEWFRTSDVSLLPVIDRVWCKTRLAKNIFDEFDVKVHYIGFSSNYDYSENSLPRSKREFLSRVGVSALRGVDEMLATWQCHPEWPPLYIVVHESRRRFPHPPNVFYIDEFETSEQYQQFASQFCFQIFATETEGFGHAIFEGLSSGAIVLVTNAAPMNELLDGDCAIFIDAVYKRHKGLSPCFTVTQVGLESAVNKVLEFTPSESNSLLSAAQVKCLEMRRSFETDLNAAIIDLEDRVSRP